MAINKRERERKEKTETETDTYLETENENQKHKKIDRKKAQRLIDGKLRKWFKTVRVTIGSSVINIEVNASTIQ